MPRLLDDQDSTADALLDLKASCIVEFLSLLASSEAGDCSAPDISTIPANALERSV